jgi:hypothetical protein
MRNSGAVRLVRNVAVAVLLLALLTVGGYAPLQAAQARQEVSPGTPIKKGFETYTLFLFPSAEWLDRAQDLDVLRKAYQNFGDAIGEKHLAVWFLDADNRTVSIARSKVFCDWLGLDYNSGPYIITTDVYPELMRANSKPVVIKLYDIPASKVVLILNILEQDLRTERGIRKTTLLFEEVKQRLLTASDLIAAILKSL